jgi:outer membrane protein assembly factor BamB
MTRLAAYVAVVIALAGCGGGGGQESTDREPQHLESGKLSDTPADEFAVVSAGGAAWAASTRGLLRLDARTARARVVVRGTIGYVVLGGDRVYAHDARNGRLFTVDPETARVVGRARLDSRGLQGLAASGTVLFAAYQTDPPILFRIDTNSGAVDRLRLQDAPALAQISPLAVLEGDVWVASPNALHRIDAATFAIRDRIKAPAGIDGVWAGGGALWAASSTEGAGVWRFDTRSGKFGSERRADAAAMAFTADAAWLAARSGPKALDLDTGAVLMEGGMNPSSEEGPTGIAVLGDELWVLYRDVKQIQRLPIPEGL